MTIDFRFVFSATLLVGSAMFLHAHQKGETVPSRQPLSAIPLQIGAWRGFDEPIAPDILKTLGNGDFLLRRYRGESDNSSSVSVFMAYFPSQRAGDTLHSPLNCLPGSGWFPLEASRTTLSFARHESFQVNRYYVAKGSDRALVFYWYWSHGRGLASEYAAKFYLVADAIRLNRSDGALIRVSAPVRAGESTARAEQQLISLCQQLLPLIDSYVPR